MKSGNTRIEFFVCLYSVTVELELGRIQKCFLRSKAGHDMVDRLNEVDYIHHRTVRHSRRDIARDRIRYRRSEVGKIQLLLPCALTVEYIAVALYEDMTRTEHIRELADLTCIFDRLIERFSEVVRNKYREVGVLALELLI